MTARPHAGSAAPPRARRVRRSQEDRREATIRKLLDAAAETLIEEGYAATSVQKVCARAGVSQGGLFRHFPTREKLMVAVGEEVWRRLLERYRDEFEALRGEEEPLALALRLVRETCRSRENQAWYELAMAARTRTTLREALAPFARRYYAAIERLARELLPGVAATFGDSFGPLVDTLIAVFDGESVRRFVLDGRSADPDRLELVLDLVAFAARRG